MKQWGKRFAAMSLAAALALPGMGAARANNAPDTAPPEDMGTGTYLADEGVMLPDGVEVLGEYKGMRLVEGDSSLAALDGVSENVPFLASTGTGMPEEGPEISGNAFTNLDKALEDAPKSKLRARKPYTVALIDTGAPDGQTGVSMLGDDGADRHGHATLMAGMMKITGGEVNILPIKALDDKGHGDASTIYAAIQYAIAQDVDAINLSLYGYATEGNAAVEKAIKEAVKRGITVVGAAGNDGADAKYYLPGRVEEAVIVGAATAGGQRLSTSNYGETVDLFLPANSTSEAAARFSGYLSGNGGDLETAMNYGVEPGDDGQPSMPENPEIGQWVPIPNEDGFQSAIMDNSFIIDTTDKSTLMDSSGVKVYNKSVSIKVTMHNFRVDGESYVSTHADGVSREGDYLKILYKNAGKYGKQAMDIEVKLVMGDSTRYPAGSTTRISAPTGSKHNIYGGWTYWCGTNVACEYTFYKAGTSTKLNIPWLYLTVGSINMGEGFLPYDQLCSYYKLNGAYPGLYYIESGEHDSGRGGPPYAYVYDWTCYMDGFWIINRTSNAFTDSKDAPDFWKSRLTVRCDSQGKGQFQYYLLTDDMWFAPCFTAPGPVADAPEKSIRETNDDGDYVYKKSVNKRAGDTVVFEVEQPVEVYGEYGEGLLKYNKFSFKDVLPEGLEYQSARVVKRKDGRDTNVTSHGTLTNNGQTVTFKFDSSYLNSGMEYVGESYVLVITTKLTNDGGDRPLKNKASTTICDVTQETNEVSVNQYYIYKFHANKPSAAQGTVKNMPSQIKELWGTVCGEPDDTPTLKGYKFKGWNTKANGTGSAYNSSEKMKKDKDFYAQWEPQKYYVAYNANGGTNFNHADGEYTQNKTAGTMAKSTFYFDTAGTLRANAFTREGFVFTGWNTKADGTGTAYADGYANVLNWADDAEGTVTLYAQWQKLYGTETLTVVSEETGNRIPGVVLKLYKKVNGSWVDTGVSATTNAQGQATVSGLFWYDHEWRSVSVPAGYRGMTNVGFSVYPNCNAPNGLCSHTSGTRPSNGAASLSLTHTRILYMKHVSLKLNSTVSEIIRGENAPAFVYHVEGRDAAGVRHAYDVMVQTNGNTRRGTNRVPDMFAGTYTVTQKPISRYNAGNAAANRNAVVSGINGTANLLSVDDGDYAEITFPYTIRQMGGFGSYHSQTNQLTR